MFESFAGNSALSIGAFYFVYNAINPYLGPIVQFIKLILLDFILKCANYKYEEYDNYINIISIFKFLNENNNKSWSFINAKKISFEDKKIMTSNNSFVRLGNFLLYINGYGYVYYSCNNARDSSAPKAYLIAPKKLILLINNKLNDLDIIKRVHNKTGYTILQIGKNPSYKEKEKYIETPLQKIIIKKIKNFAENVFPVLYKHNLPTVYSLLLHGPPGTGKTSICNMIAGELAAELLNFNISNIEKSQILINNSGYNPRTIKVIAINELDLYYKQESQTLGENKNNAFIEYIHDLLENSGSCIENRFIIVIATTNDYPTIAEKDPATIMRFKEIIEMPKLTTREAKQFAKNYAALILDKNAECLDAKISKLDVTSIREITKFVTKHATDILVEELGAPLNP